MFEPVFVLLSPLQVEMLVLKLCLQVLAMCAQDSLKHFLFVFGSGCSQSYQIHSEIKFINVNIILTYSSPFHQAMGMVTAKATELVSAALKLKKEKERWDLLYWKSQRLSEIIKKC